MGSIQPSLIQKLQKLSDRRLAEVEDFVEFLATREERATAAQRLGEAFEKLDALKLPPISDEDIDAEVQAARQARRTQQSA
jgi:hypothetical protein